MNPGAHIIYLGNRNFAPEFSLQEDIGVSIRYNGVSADISVFNNNIKNYIYLTMLADENNNPLTDAQGNKTYQYQQAAAQLYGMEVWLAFHPQQLQGFSFSNSLAIVYGYNRNEAYKGKGLQGEYLPLIPPVKLMSNISQKVDTKSKVITSFSPKFEMEFNAAQNKFLELNNTETSTAAFALFNIGVSTDISYSKNHALQFQLQVNNLLDASYQSHLSRLKYFEYYSSSLNNRSGIYNMGRNICFKMIMPFN